LILRLFLADLFLDMLECLADEFAIRRSRVRGVNCARQFTHWKTDSEYKRHTFSYEVTS
jgi:hypothetical protein